MKKRLMILTALICLWGLMGCNVLINPAAVIVVLDSQSNKIANSIGNFDFSEVLINTAKSETFTIQNIGKKDLLLNGSPKVEITGSGANAFKVTLQPESPISPNKETTFEIEFKPMLVQVYSATITIANNAASTSLSYQNPFVFTISGTGIILPEINVKQGSTDILCTKGVFDFGGVIVGNSSPATVFTIENIGDLDLILTGNPDLIQKTGTDANLFAINQTATVSTLKPKFWTTFAVYFNPNSYGVKSATIVIPNNDKDENPYTFTVKGTGQLSVNEPEINVRQDNFNIPCTTGTFDFGTIEVGNSSIPFIFTIENLGNADLLLTGTPLIEISGADAAMFAMNQTATFSPISPSSYAVFTITFSPTRGGSKTVTIRIPNNDSDENPFTFTIKGTCLSRNLTYCWTKRYGGYYPEHGYSLTYDSSNNIYITGTFHKTVNFGEDFGLNDVKTTVSTDRAENFITKINTNGTYGGTKRIGGVANDSGKSLTMDTSGNIFLTGQFWDTVDFGNDFGVTDVKTSAGRSDAFVTKINANGTYGWTKRIGGLSDDTGSSIITDNIGNIYITGIFNQNVNFMSDFGGTDNKTSNGINNIFITKINANGTYGWTMKFVRNYNDNRTYLTIDSSGNIFLTGVFQGTVNFGEDFGVSDYKTFLGGIDIFVTKINANETYGWTKHIGGTSNDFVKSITTDSSGNIFVYGSFRNTVDFGTGFGVSDIKTPLGRGDDVFITKINANGTYGWTKQIGGTNSLWASSSCIDTYGDIYFLGQYGGTVDFGADFGVSDVKSNNYAAIFITKIYANGEYGWTKEINGMMLWAYSIIVDSLGNIHLSGEFSETIDFGKDFGVSDIKNPASFLNDAFVTKIAQN